jgi:hypothetical protein
VLEPRIYTDCRTNRAAGCAPFNILMTVLVADLFAFGDALILAEL